MQESTNPLDKFQKGETSRHANPTQNNVAEIFSFHNHMNILRASAQPLTTLLLGDTDGAATATGGLGVLTADAEAPVVTETTVGADLLEALKIVTELRVDTVGQDLRVLAVDNIALSVEEPGGDLVLGGVLDDGDNTLELFGGELTGAGRS